MKEGERAILPVHSSSEIITPYRIWKPHVEFKVSQPGTLHVSERGPFAAPTVLLNVALTKR
jgi:hypothetical protein